MFVNLHSRPHYSRDYYVRMNDYNLRHSDWRHVFSELTFADMSSLEGYTEWSGQFGGKTISLSWAWLVLADGAIKVAREQPITTNIMLLDPMGYDLGAALTVEKCTVLLSWLPWEQHIIQLLSLH